MKALTGLIALRETLPLALVKMTMSKISRVIDLAQQRDAQDPSRDADVEVRQHRDQSDHRESEPVPLNVHAVPSRLQLGEVGEASDQRDLEHAVGGHHGEAAGHPQLAAQTMADEAVEAPGGGHLAGHRHVGHAEDRQHDRREDEPGRRSETVPVPDRDRRVEEHRRDRRRACDRQEQHSDQPDRSGPELVDVLAVGDVDALDHRQHSLVMRLGDSTLCRHFASPRFGLGLCSADLRAHSLFSRRGHWLRRRLAERLHEQLGHCRIPFGLPNAHPVRQKRA